MVSLYMNAVSIGQLLREVDEVGTIIGRNWSLRQQGPKMLLVEGTASIVATSLNNRNLYMFLQGVRYLGEYRIVGA